MKRVWSVRAAWIRSWWLRSSHLQCGLSIFLTVLCVLGEGFRVWGLKVLFRQGYWGTTHIKFRGDSHGRVLLDNALNVSLAITKL